MVDASEDVLEVDDGLMVIVCCPEVTTTMLPHSFGKRLPERATPMIESAGTLTVEHC